MATAGDVTDTIPPKTRRSSMSPPPDISEFWEGMEPLKTGFGRWTVPAFRIVLLGKSEDKKLKLSNLISGAQDANLSIKQCVATSGEWRGKSLTVVKTPDIFSVPQQTVRREMKKCANLCFPGPNVLLLLVKTSEFSAENKQQLQAILKVFGQNSFKYAIVVKTHKGNGTEAVVNLIRECGGRQYNMFESDQTQLMEMVEGMVRENHQTPLAFSEEAEDRKPSLNLVLCGKREHKIAVAKAMLGQSQLPLVLASSECVKYQGEVEGRWVSMVHLPALNDKSQEEAMQESLHCISLCDPEGVHAFFLVLPVEPLTDDDKTESQIIQNIFGSEASDITMPMFITESDPTHSAVVNFLEGDKGIKELRQRYREKYILNIKDKKQMPALLDRIDEIRAGCKSHSYTTTAFAQVQVGKIRQLKKDIERLNKTSILTCNDTNEQPECLRIVLIGKTGSGKSTSGNTILGRSEFIAESSMTSVTMYCQKAKCEVNGRLIEVVDTPGLYDTTMSKELVTQELVKCISLLSPGPHVFLLVLQIGRFTKEEEDTLELIKQTFGKNSEKFTIVLFTKGDTLEREGKTLEEHITRGCNEYCRKLIAACGRRCHVFNNYDENNHKQVSDLITMIDTMVKSNGGSCYTSEMFQEAEESIIKKKEENLKEKEEEMKRQKEELERKHEEEMKELERQLQEQDAEFKKLRKVDASELNYLRNHIEKEKREREKERQEREAEEKKRAERYRRQHTDYLVKIADLQSKLDELEKNQTIDKELEQKQKELIKEKDAWEKDWARRCKDDEETSKKEQEKLNSLQKEYELKVEEFEKKRKEESRIRKEQEEQLKLKLEDHKREIEKRKKEFEEEARKQAEELNDFKEKYTNDFTSLADRHMEEMKEMKMRHEFQLQEKEGRHAEQYTLLTDLSQHKERNLKEELEEMKQKHDKEIEDLGTKYHRKCMVM